MHPALPQLWPHVEEVLARYEANNCGHRRAATRAHPAMDAGHPSAADAAATCTLNAASTQTCAAEAQLKAAPQPGSTCGFLPAKLLPGVGGAARAPCPSPAQAGDAPPSVAQGGGATAGTKRTLPGFMQRPAKRAQQVRRTHACLPK